MVAFVTGLGLALLLTPVTRWWLVRIELIDHPNLRSSHSTPVPRGGGAAVAIAALVALAVSDRTTPSLAISVGALVMGVVGLIDDRVSLGTTPRLVAQFVVPISTMVWLLSGSDLSSEWLAVLGVAGIVWCAGYVNVFNFMDGINGISAAQATGAGVTLLALADHFSIGVVVAAGAALAGAALGFAVFNLRGSIFLGDVGSYFAGFWLAATAIVAVARGVPVESVLGPFALYLADAAVTLVRRWRRGAPVLEAHREHAYQRLHQLGWSHAAISGIVLGVIAVSGLASVALVDADRPVRLLGLALCVGMAASFVTLPGALSRRRASV
ncbi:MAG: hypothetical protein QNJ12_07565 [Ilumatobacter sp.]|uniref:hypothetical protein n=1 Tax=Ilumatobacter sp. TaxID=1967498 RepID=UPI00262A167D|nr:hypothetical protein [Ilumatobacter sp.]MDJ0768636.1 hypothetical protein [Ilumatobacter sp.]